MSKHHSVKLAMPQFLEVLKQHRAGEAVDLMANPGNIETGDTITVYVDTFDFSPINFDVVRADVCDITVQALTVEQKDALGWYGRA